VAKRRAQAKLRSKQLRSPIAVESIAVEVRSKTDIKNVICKLGSWGACSFCPANDTHVATLVKRNTRFTMLVKIPLEDTTTVVAALAKHISKLPEELRCSLTWDQGKEMHAHRRFTVATNVQVYFCDPRSPWQRGSNENTNGLLRQYQSCADAQPRVVRQYRLGLDSQIQFASPLRSSAQVHTSPTFL
jgi:IS30 family transposase